LHKQSTRNIKKTN